MMFGKLRMARGEIGDATPDNRVASPIFLAAALAIFFGVVLLALVVADAGMAKVLTVMPMLMLCLLAWRRLPVKAVVVASLAGLAGWIWQGPRALWTLAPAATFAFLWLLERSGKGVRPLLPGTVPLLGLSRHAVSKEGTVPDIGTVPRGLTPFSVLRWIPPATVVALAALCSVLFQIDNGRVPLYEEAWMEGDRAWVEGSEPRADAAYSRADGLRPRELMSFYLAVRDMMNIDPADPAFAARLLQRRIPRIVRELEEIVRRDEEYVSARQDLARFYLLEGRVADARAQYVSMRRLRPKDPDILVMLGYFLLREGKTDEARPVCEEALRLKDPPVEAMVNLGVIRFAEGKDEEARSLWERALAKDPKQPIARLNLRKIGVASPISRAVDVRCLAQTKEGVQLAPWVYNLAVFGRGYLRGDRIRLFAESAQLDPTYVAPHVRLARAYLESGSLAEPEQALWHARRAVDLAPEAVVEAGLAVALARRGGADAEIAAALAQKSNAEDDVAESLLVLGYALAATGDRAGARTVLEEGRAKAPARMIPQFDALLERLKSPGP
jgi:Flp pilus assembly protein TadD